MVKRGLTLLFWLALVGVGLGGGFTMWGPMVRQTEQQPPPQTALIAEQFPDRKFIAPVQLKGEDGTAASEDFLIDTGAVSVTVSTEIYQNLHLVPLSEAVVSGVVGSQRSVQVRIPEMKIGDIVLHNIEALVVPDANLLGMTFLEQMRRVEIQGSVLTLEK